jgi:hemerythrin-like domain-containing protein
VINPPLNRHPALQPLSREHFNGLRQARQLVMSAEQDETTRMAAAADFTKAWTEEISAHFDDEERMLLPLLEAEDRQRLLDEHKELRRLAGEVCDSEGPPSQALAEQLGTLLHDHIRWEERVLFQKVQETAGDEKLTALLEDAQRIEAERTGSRRRGEKRSCGCRCGCGKKTEGADGKDG